MADSKKAKHKKAPAEQLTPEQQAALLVAQQKADAEAKAEQERVFAYGSAVKKMSHRQLVGEFKRLIRREHAGRPPVPQPGLNLAYGVVFLTVLENTKTPTRVFETDADGKPTRVGRLDQMNQLGRLAHYLR